MTTSHKTDPRVIRTRQMLRDALIKVILEKGYDSITVQDITDAAGLRRATFYLHYRDKEELLLTILREAFDQLVTQMDAQPEPASSLGAAYRSYFAIFQHAQQNATLYRCLLAGQGSALILRYVREYLVNNLKQHCGSYLLEPGLPLEVLANYMAALKLNMVTWWLEAGMPYPVEQMADMCAALERNGTGDMLREEHLPVGQ